MNNKVLFIGGTGVISSACAPAAVRKGFDLYLLRRGQSTRPAPEEAITLTGDIRDPESVKRAIGDMEFDAVVDFIAFTPEHVAADIETFRGRTGQYVFISSASAYQTPPARLPVVESTPLRNPYWEYSRNKIACEDLLVREYRENGFPATIVRPSHTYDKTLLPFDSGFTAIDRMRRGKKIIVHGDGTSLWTMTHHKDFAKAFTGLLANPRAIGEAYHITSDDYWTWDQIAEIFADAAGTVADIVHVPSEVIATYDARWGAGLLGDKAHSMVFDNSKIKNLVPDFKATIPLQAGAREVMDWYDADPARGKVDPSRDALIDAIIAAQQGARAKAG
ncbi:MAG: SDR family oxidoreductase [Capsulimonadaceae bacterium]|nr:SDR family oxidoreductase [Capsulimonadaceae bacterium]